MNEQTKKPKYFTDKRAACVCDECGSYADNSMMVKHYATCTFAEASEITRLLSLVEGQAQTITQLREALEDIESCHRFNDPADSANYAMEVAKSTLASTAPSKDGQG